MRLISLEEEEEERKSSIIAIINAIMIIFFGVVSKSSQRDDDDTSFIHHTTSATPVRLCIIHISSDVDVATGRVIAAQTTNRATDRRRGKPWGSFSDIIKQHQCSGDAVDDDGGKCSDERRRLWRNRLKLDSRFIVTSVIQCCQLNDQRGRVEGGVGR